MRRYGETLIWDYQTGKQIARLVHCDEELWIDWVAWSRDGSKIATACDDSTVRVWDARTWEPLYVVHHEPPTFANTVAWSPDSKRLLTTAGNDEQGAKDTTARVWDAATGKELLVFSSHHKTVMSGDWSPNGKRIATASGDGILKMWDAATGDELLTLSFPTLFYVAGWWSPDGQHLAVVGTETLVSVWRVWQSTEELVDYARDCCVVRELTPAERQQFGLP